MFNQRRRDSSEHPTSAVRRDARGQSLVEFALVLPVILLLTMVVLDFGRVYLGYVNLQNMARIAANFAADNATAWGTPGNATTRGYYSDRIVADARASNCSLPMVGNVPQVPAPTFTDRGSNGTTADLGDSASVSLTCTFPIVTPFISAIFGTNGLSVSASSEFPVKSGMSGTSGVVVVGSPPTANFIANPTSGFAPLVVRFSDTSGGSPTSWAWDFTEDGIVDSTAQDPQWTFTGVGAYDVTLIATNAAGSSTVTKANFISVSIAPAVVDFTANPTSGTRPLVVQFTDTSTGSPTAWDWDFDNNGTIDSTLQNPTWTYTSAGTYTVTLTVANAGGPASKTVPNMISVSVGTCTVPNFAGTSTDTAQARWSSAGFTTTVNYQQGNLPWTIKSQTQVVGLTIPCNSSITVSKN